MSFRTLDNVQVAGKRVLVRADLNVPVRDGKISDLTRLERLTPTIRELAQKDVLQAGAYFKVTPSVRVGGAVALGDSKNLATEQLPIQQAPRVRLETTFKF